MINCPEMLQDGTADRFPADAQARAQKMLSSIPSNIGAYSESKGAHAYTHFAYPPSPKQACP